MYIISSAMVAQQRMVLVVSGLSQLEVVFTCNDFPCVIGVVVDNIFCGGCLVCTQINAVDIGRCLLTAFAVSPGQLVKQ